jgi:hypothetical protein
MRLCRCIVPLLAFAAYIFLRSARSLSSVQSIIRTSDSDERERRIAEAAYYRAERRGFTPGFELADWIAAEQELDGCTAADGQFADPNNNRDGQNDSRR